VTASGSRLLYMLHQASALPSADAVVACCAQCIGEIPGVLSASVTLEHSVQDARAEAAGQWLVPFGREGGHNQGVCCLQLAPDADASELLTDIGTALSLVAAELDARTQRQHLATQTAEAQAQFALLANHTTDMFVVTDADDHIEWVNPAFTTRTGYALEAIVGQSSRALLRGADTAPEAETALNNAIHERRPIDIEMTYYSRGGRPFWAEISMRPVPATEGQGTRFVTVLRDRTERRRTREALLEARDAAQAADRAKTKFVAMMSHELRTPLNAIKGFSELARDMAGGTPQLAEYLGYIISATENLTRLINNILEFARLGSGFVQLDPSAAQPREIAQSVLRELTAPAQAKGLAIEVKTPDESAPIFIDATKLRQIIQNLVGNAIKYSDSGNIKVTLSLENADQLDRTYLTIRVEDSGIGIHATDIDNIFEPFFQAESGHTRRHEGSGLGLAIVRQLVETMAGAISVQSTHGVGSTFTVRLPAARATVPQTARPNPVTYLSGTALVVDDNRLNVMLLQNMLERLGMQVRTAASGFEALGYAASTPYDIILMDLQMPEMDGFETMRRLRAGDGPNARVPLIAVSAHASALHHQQAVDSGAVAFLHKPFTRDALLDMVVQVLGGEGAPRESAEHVIASSRG
jgi:two-component system, sensor histidine kinase